MTTPASVFDFSLPRPDGGTLELREFAGHPLLIVNTASRCGFTGQYAGLQSLWEHYREAGLVVIGVPSNDFGGQEPGSNSDIDAFCQKNYGVTFPLSAKLAVSGRAAHPLFRHLAAQGSLISRPRWNFHKYVVGRDGRLANWFSSLTNPGSSRVKRAIEQLIRA